jgi:hypothetical protein
MAQRLEDLEAEALQLPEKSRAKLAKVLILSLSEPDEEETDRIWAEEAEYRFLELQRGEVAGQDSEEVFREARSRLK